MNRGQSLIELLLVIGLAALLLPAIITGFITSRQGRPQQQQRLAGSALLKETGDAVRSVRDNSGWLALPTAGSTLYYPNVNATTNAWELLVSADQVNGESINGFYRKILISEVNRDPVSGAIVTTGGVVDPSTKKFDITVSWSQPYASSITSAFYLTRQEDITLIETTQNEFSQGTLTGVNTDSPSNNPDSPDGEITLATGGGGDWCSPGVPKFKLNLNGQAYAGAVVAGSDRAYVGMGKDASGADFYNVLVNTTGNDPTATCSDPSCLYNPAPALKTNDIFGETFNGKRYAYLATNNNHKEVVVLDVSSASPQLLREIDLPGNGNALSVYVENSYLYVSDNDQKIYVYLLAPNRSDEPILKGSSPTMPAIGNNISVVNGIVFVAMNSISNQFQIVDASNPTSPILKGSLAVNSANTQRGVDITAKPDGSRAYLVVTLSTATNVAEFFIIDTDQSHSYDNPSIKAFVDTHSHGDMDPKAVTLVSGNKAIIVGYGGEEYEVYKNLETDNLNFCGSTDVANLDINGVSSIIGDNSKTYSYIVTSDASNEFQIIEGGSGGLYASSGTYTSKTYSYPQLTSFNRLSATINQPISTSTVKFQVGVATGNASAPYCDGVTFTYVGPDGSSPSGYSTSGYYETTTTGIGTVSGVIPFGNVISTYNDPGRCFSYKAFLSTSDSTQTPIFYDITINYSP